MPVNNAFYQSRESQYSLVDMRMEHLDKQIRVNLLAPLYLAKLVLPQMLERSEGAVINMVSARCPRAQRGARQARGASATGPARRA